MRGVHLQKVAFGQGAWVVVGQEGTLATSTDLRHWTERSTHWGTADNIANVVYADGRFVATGSDDAGGSRFIAVSGDGVSWSPRTVPVRADRLGPLHYSDRLGRWFVSGRLDNRPVFLSSPDLDTWTAHDAGFADDPIISISEGHGKLLIAGGAEKIGTSVDGVAWSIRELGHSAEDVNDIDKARFFDGVFLAIMHPDPSVVYRSADGASWTAVSTGWPEREPDCLVWECPGGVGGWVMIGQRDDGTILVTGLYGKMMESRDLGASWTTLESPVDVHLNGVATDGHRFVVVGNEGTMLVSDR